MGSPTLSEGTIHPLLPPPPCQLHWGLHGEQGLASSALASLLMWQLCLHQPAASAPHTLGKIPSSCRSSPLQGSIPMHYCPFSLLSVLLGGFLAVWLRVHCRLHLSSSLQLLPSLPDATQASHHLLHEFSYLGYPSYHATFRWQVCHLSLPHTLQTTPYPTSPAGAAAFLTLSV